MCLNVALAGVFADSNNAGQPTSVRGKTVGGPKSQMCFFYSVIFTHFVHF